MIIFFNLSQSFFNKLSAVPSGGMSTVALCMLVSEAGAGAVILSHSKWAV